MRIKKSTRKSTPDYHAYDRATQRSIDRSERRREMGRWDGITKIWKVGEERVWWTWKGAHG